MDRFLLIVERIGGRTEQRARATLDTAAWRHIAIGDQAQLYLSRTACVSMETDGVLIGPVFGRGMRQPIASFAPGEWGSVRATNGSVLIERYWGSYVAILPDRDRIQIVRAPFGALPCYWRLTEKGTALASDLDLLALAGRCDEVAPSALARYLAREDSLSDETCMRSVGELRGGDRLALADGRPDGTETLWSPWHFAGEKTLRIDNAEDAMRRLGDTVRLSVAASTAAHDHVVLLLSGGLDSAIVAASLVDTGKAFTGLNLVSDNAGDERRYARLVAEACGAALLERERESAGVDLSRSLSAGQPRPLARAFSQETHRQAARALRQTGASACLDGGGGDNVFYAYLSVAPLAELFRDEGFSPRFRKKTAALSALSMVGYFKVIVRAIMRAWRPASVTRLPDLGFMSKDAREAVASAPAHPWMTAPPGIGPGTASAVSMLPQVQGYVESRDVRAPFPSVSPLMTQPVIETCLRIPCWMWFEDWNSRVVARRAFADRLPKAVIYRRSKGTPEEFDGALLEARWRQIADMLLDGELRDIGLLDVAAVERALARNTVVRDHDFGRIMRLVDAEAWLRSWR